MSPGILTSVRETIQNRVSYRLMKRRKKDLAARFDRQFDATVAYGLFAGLRLHPEPFWGRADRASMLFGLYETEVLRSLAAKPEHYRTFIDVGAADGYYAIGALTSGLFDEVICFEISQDGRRVIRENAERNGVGERIVIHGKATSAAIAALPRETLDRAVILVDIEGAEFDLFDRELFARLRRSILIMELHDFLVPDGERALARLRAAAEPWFEITELRTSSRDLSPFAELHELSDLDRWLLCSEGRPRLMSWLRFDPKLDGKAEPVVGGDGLEPPTLSV